MNKDFLALIYLLFSGAICAQDITFCGYDSGGSKVMLGVCPCVGVGLVDMDLVLPVELRIGHVQYLEPTIRVGYNFGLRKKSKK